MINRTRDKKFRIFEPMLSGLRQASRPVLALPRYTKRIIVLLVDISSCVMTVWLAFYLRLGEFVSLSDNAFWAVAISVAFALPIFIVSGLYRMIFRYSGYPAIVCGCPFHWCVWAAFLQASLQQLVLQVFRAQWG